MKKTKILYGTLALTGLALTACSSEEPLNKGNGTAGENGEIRYMKVAIATAPSTRAAEFADATEAENAVNGMYFKFYDSTGKPISADVMITDTSFEDVADPEGGPINNVGKVQTKTLQLSIDRNAPYPAYVVCFINPVNYGELTSAENMSQLRDQTRDDYKDNDGDFAMNNSVYYGDDPVSGANQVKMFGAPILADQLKHSKAEADEADAEDIVNIYVERYAAKVVFNLADNAIKPVTQGGYTLTFVPEVWTINADAPNMYASKRFDDTNSTTTNIPTYTDVQNMLGTWTTWNDATNHRSYWACSPSYYADVFPEVSDDIIDRVESGTGAGEAVAPYALKYYSYNQATATEGDGAGVTAMNTGGANWKYTMENTMGPAAFASRNPKAAAPSVILVGHYDVTTADGTAVGVDNGFCIYGNELYFRGTIPAGAPEGAMLMRDRFFNANTILAIDNKGTLLKANNVPAGVLNCFTVTHPSKEVRGTQPVPHRYVTLQLKSDATIPANSLYYKPMGSDQWMPVTQDNISNLNTLLWQQLGNASSYTENKCYFSIPIQHLGITENTAPSPITADGSIDWTKVRVGDFGLVRNHVYTLNVSEIGGRANGIENLDNPLVPSMDQNDFWIRYQVNILNWRVVPVQGNIKL